MMIGGGIRGPRSHHRGKRPLSDHLGGGTARPQEQASRTLPVQPVSLKNVVICHTARMTSFHMIKESSQQSKSKEGAEAAQASSTNLLSATSESSMKYDKRHSDDVPKPQNKSFSSKRLTRIIVYILAQCVPCYRQKILQYSFREGETKEIKIFKPFASYNEVTSTCLWHACRAISIGIILILAGITMAILGYLSDLKGLDAEAAKGNESFKLNNLSFAGPVVMGFGGFLIVAACVMTFETRDNAAKIGPTASDKSNGLPQNIPQVVQFKSSSSQTTFLDRNIVQTLNTPSINIGSPSSSFTRQSKISPLPSSPINTSSSMERYNTEGNSASVSLAVKRSRFRGSNNSHSGSGSTTKRASISGQLPLEDPSTMEPGLAIMDEIGRQALNSTFLNFQRSTAQKLATYFQSDEIVLDPLCVPNSLPKCPSAPHIPQEPIQDHQLSSANTSSENPENNKKYEKKGSKAGKYYQYKVLTPTMYRSCMAATRQAVSMDCEGTNEHHPHKLHREETSLRVQSPLIKRQISPNESIDLELGASATTHFSKHPRSLPQKHYSADDEESGSLTLDLHVEGARPVTLVVKDESKCSGGLLSGSFSRGGSLSKKDWSRSSKKSLEELAEDLDFIDEDTVSLPEEKSLFTCTSIEYDYSSSKTPSVVLIPSGSTKVTLNLASPEDITDEEEVLHPRKYSQRHFLRRQNKIDASNSPRL